LRGIVEEYCENTPNSPQLSIAVLILQNSSPIIEYSSTTPLFGLLFSNHSRLLRHNYFKKDLMKKERLDYCLPDFSGKDYFQFFLLCCTLDFLGNTFACG
jgi:hypothetical protein